VFIHSSWRTSSTWFWTQFRAVPATICFYEPFNERLATLNKDSIQVGPTSWDSGHPVGDPYFLEYLPLLNDPGGVQLYDPAMAVDWFIPDGGLNGNLRASEVRYVDSLLGFARERGLSPVLGFCRSLGRIAAIKRQFGGAHIFQYRNLWSQWMSYFALKEHGSVWFCNMLFEIAGRNKDSFLNGLHERYWTKTFPVSELTHTKLFEMFMAVHLYLYAHAELAADLSVDVTRLGRDPAYSSKIQREIAELTEIKLATTNARHTQQFAMIDPLELDWGEIKAHGRSAVSALAQMYATARCEEIVSRLIEEAHSEMLESERYLESARKYISGIAKKNVEFIKRIDQRTDRRILHKGAEFLRGIARLLSSS